MYHEQILCYCNIYNTSQYRKASSYVTVCVCNFIIIFIIDGTSVSLTHHHANDINYYDATINNSDNINPLEKFYLITEQKWHKDTLVPISLLPSTKGMPTRSHHR